MPIMAIYRATGVSRADYERYRELVPLEPAPPEALAHIYTHTEDGSLCVVDVWQDRAALERFATRDIAPALEKIGIPFIAPEVLEVETLAVIGDLEKYRVARQAPVPA